MKDSSMSIGRNSPQLYCTLPPVLLGDQTKLCAADFNLKMRILGQLGSFHALW